MKELSTVPCIPTSAFMAIAIAEAAIAVLGILVFRRGAWEQKVV